MSETQFKNMSGNALWHDWHRWLGHCPMQTIRDTIPHAKEIEEPRKARFGPKRPRSREHSQRQPERVYMDIMSSSVI